MVYFTLEVNGVEVPIERIKTIEIHPSADPDTWEAIIKPDVSVTKGDTVSIKRHKGASPEYFVGLVEEIEKTAGQGRQVKISGRSVAVKLWRKWAERNEDPKAGGFWKDYYAHEMVKFWVRRCSSDDVAVGTFHRLGWGIKPDAWTCTAIAGSGIDNIKDRLNTVGWELGRNQQNGDWVKIDLGSSKTVAGIRIENRYDNKYLVNWKVQTSPDDSSYTDRASGSVGTGLNYSNIVASWSPVSVRYIKVLCTADYAKEWNITEVFIYTSDGDISGISLGTFDTSAHLTEKALDFSWQRITERIWQLSQQVHTSNIPWEFWIDKDGKVYLKERRGSDKSSTIKFRYSSELGDIKRSSDIKQRADRVKVLGKGSGHDQDLHSSSWVGSGDYELVIAEKSAENKEQADARATIIQNERGQDIESVKGKIENDPYDTGDWGVGDDVALTELRTGLSGSYRVKKVIRDWKPDSGETVTVETVTKWADATESIKKMRREYEIWNKGGGSAVDDFDTPPTPSGFDANDVATGVAMSEDGVARPYFIVTVPRVDAATSYGLRVRKSGESDWAEFDVKQSALGGDPTSKIMVPLVNITYQFQCCSVGKVGNKSDWVPLSPVEKSSTPDPDAPAIPTGLAATAEMDAIFLQWTINTEEDFRWYIIYRDTSSPATSEYARTPSNKFVDEDVDYGTTYYYRLKAEDRSGNRSGYSSEVNASPNRPGATDLDNPPGAPSDPASAVVGTAVLNGVLLGWSYSEPLDFSHYEIYKNTTNNSGTAIKIAESRTNYFLWKVETSDDYVTQYFWIKAVDWTDHISGFSPDMGAGVTPLRVKPIDLTIESRPWNSDIEFYWDESDYNKIYWRKEGQSSNADIKFADGTVEQINYGNVDALADDTHYFYWDENYKTGGDYDVQHSTVISNAVGEGKGLLATVQIDAATPKSPTILIFSSYLPTIGAGAIAVKAIMSQHLVTDQAVITAQAQIANSMIVNDHVVSINCPKIVIDGVVYLSSWRKTGDLTKIDGGEISAETVTATQITADWITAKKFRTAGSGARIEFDATSIRGLDASSNEQFKIQSSDGKAMAGAGAVILDSDGIKIKGQFLKMYSALGFGEDAYRGLLYGGATSLILSSEGPLDLNAGVNVGLYLHSDGILVGTPSTKSMYPKTDNYSGLGTSTKQWKEIWGVDIFGFIHKIQLRTSDPGSPENGEVWLRTDL